MKKILNFLPLTIILMLFVNIEVKASFPSSLTSFTIPYYCSGEACYCGPYDDTNSFKVALFDKDVLEKATDSDYLIGPNSDNTNKPVGLIYLAVSDGEKTIVKCLENQFDADVRNSNRLSASDEAIKMILEMIGE